MEQVKKLSRTDLLEQLAMKDMQIQAQRKRITHLEKCLIGATVKAQNKYERNKKFFEIIQGKIMKMYLDIGAGIGMDAKTLLKEYAVRYPHANIANVLRRVYELIEKGMLWSEEDPHTKRVTFYLKVDTPKGVIPKDV